MNRHEQDTHDRLTDAASALDQAYRVTGDLGHVNRTRLAAAVGHLAEIARGVALVLGNCATGARGLSEQTDDRTTAEVHHDIHQATSNARSAARDVRQALMRAHETAWKAHSTREPGPGERSPMTGEDVRDLLETAATRLSDNGHPVTDPAALPAIVTALTHITARLINLTSRCTTAAARLAQRSTTNAAITAHRDTEYALSKAVILARTLRRELHPVQTCAERARELATRRNRSKNT
ncbi:hypothetical protein [Saccharothrix deserti]|uniref:hypothetical protein n=1 Tax=Saccharothrix deserti TaxID=2593674 RepID=UPI00131BF935|nr:hypothetical protein [Saccharothrix deserti]